MYTRLYSLKDLRITEDQLKEPKITIGKAIQIGQAVEETKKQTKELTNFDIREMNVSSIKCKQKTKPGTPINSNEHNKKSNK